MGYQESLIKIKNRNDFNKIAIYLSDSSDKLNMFFNPCTAVTFREKLNVWKGSMYLNKITFDRGETAICIQGERFAQNANFIFQYKPEFASKVDIVPIDWIQEDKLKEIFESHEKAFERPFEDYVSLIKQNHGISNVKQVYMTAEEYEELSKEHKENFYSITSKFRESLSKADNPIAEKEIVYGYIEDLFNNYDKYGDFIKHMDEDMADMLQALQEEYSLDYKRVSNMVLEHSKDPENDMIYICNVVSKESAADLSSEKDLSKDRSK